jgi:DNA repair photolyase
MSVIYIPKGKAREYSPLALNLFNGCDHQCTYCYVPLITGKVLTTPMIREGVLEKIKKEAAKITKPCPQVLMSFTTDPYNHYDVEPHVTRDALEILYDNQIPVAVLTKGGSRCLRDLDVFKKFGSAIKVGATLTFVSDSMSKEYEPFAANPSDRMATLIQLHQKGIRTFVSIEPVINPIQSLAAMEVTLDYVDEYKIGKLNHQTSTTDWNKFLHQALEIMRENKKPCYIKNDLAKFAERGFTFTKEERDCDFLNVHWPEK